MRLPRILLKMGRQGEHYLARTPKEYLRVLARSGGGGLVTAGTVGLKFAASASGMAPAGEALAGFLNYGTSFLGMQALGFRLATKQPALFAANLCRRRHRSRLSSRLSTIRATTRTQFASAVGNFGAVVLAMTASHGLYVKLYGRELLSAEAAHLAIASLDPFMSGTLWYATLTGGALWLSGLVMGLVRGRALGAVAFNLTLAAQLALLPFLGKALALPLDVRHFTLASGALSLSVSTLGLGPALQAGLPQAMLGILAIGFLNFTVSFVLSLLHTAIGKVRERVLDGLKEAGSEFLRAPWPFLLPVKGMNQEA